MASIVFHIPEGTAQTLSQLQQTAQRVLRAEPIHQRWVLEHKLFRSTPNPSAQQPQGEPVRYHHLLNLGHIPGKTFLYITEPYNPQTGVTDPKLAKDGNGEAVVLAIPAQQSDGFAQLLMYKLSALWIPRYSHTIHSGTSYSYGEFIIRMGEVRTSGQQGQNRGVVVCISQQAVDDDDDAEEQEEDKESAEAGVPLGEANGASTEETNGVNAQDEELEIQYKIIREVWERFKVQAAKETVIKKPGQSEKERNFAQVRMWGDLLKFRG